MNHVGLGRWLDAAKRLQGDIDELGLRGSRGKFEPEQSDRTYIEEFDQLVTDPELRSVSRALFEIEHYARAVEEAFKCLNNAVKRKSGLKAQDGAGLMKSAFSANSPRLALNDLSTKSEKDEQLGYMEIYAGAITGIRNPRAHEHELEDKPEIAIELLTLANHLMRKLDAATKKP